MIHRNDHPTHILSVDSSRKHLIGREKQKKEKELKKLAMQSDISS